MRQSCLWRLLKQRSTNCLWLIAVVSVMGIYLYLRPVPVGDSTTEHHQLGLDPRDSIPIHRSAPSMLKAGYRNLLASNHGNVWNCVSGTHVRLKNNHKSQDLTLNLTGTGENDTKRQQAFMRVYSKGEWYDGALPKVGVYKTVGGSGAGSTLHWAQEAIAALHVLITALKAELKKDKIQILDIPCGDMVWMSRFLQTREDVEYTGMDIVPKLIQRHKTAFKAFPWTFIHHDIASSGLNATYDIILSRMMLQHLRTEDALKVLNHMSKSGSKYLLTTTFSGQPGNGELPNNRGRFRLLNLELPPFALHPPICTVRDGDIASGAHHYISLWRLPLKQVLNCTATVHHPHGAGFLKNFYSCA